MANIKDLAKMAGVSVTTVSRVLNDHPYVSEEKRKAVEEAIRETNYQKNINAVNLIRGETKLIGVIVPFFEHPYFSLVLKGISNKAIEKNYKLVLFQTEYQEEREKEAFQMLREKQIDALIICSRAGDLSLVEEHVQYGPVVLFEKITDKDFSATYVNHYRIFQKGLDYLYEKGHTKIGYCIGRRNSTNSKMREQAYKDFHETYNLPYNPEYILDETLTFEDGEKVIDDIAEMSAPPTAMLVTGDQVVAGMLLEAYKRGISIPEDLALIGFNNEPIARAMGITTIEIPLVKAGENLFLQAMSDSITYTEMPGRFIERKTV